MIEVGIRYVEQALAFNQFQICSFGLPYTNLNLEKDESGFYKAIW